MLRHIFIFSVSLLISFGAAEAQLFKGRAARQSGGSNNSFNSGGNFNNGSMQRESGGGLFQRGRERREERQYNNSPQYSNNSMQQQPKTGLFGKEKEPRQGLFGNRQSQQTTDSKPGLFQKARERREADTYQNYSNSSTNRYANNGYQQNNYASPSQSNSSFVRSTQKVTSGTQLFTNSNAGGSNTAAQSPGSFVSNASQSIVNRIDQAQPASLSRIESQATNPSSLPAAIVTATTNVRRQPATPDIVAKKAPQAARRPQPQPPKIKIMGSSLKEAAPARPDVKPTGNLPNNDQQEIEIAAAVLA